MKKMTLITMFILTIILMPICYAENVQNDNIIGNTIVNNINTEETNENNLKDYGKEQGTEQLVQIKEKTKKKLDDYKNEYRSDAYGLAAYILNAVRIYSIPFCFIGIAIGAIYQYVIGIHKLDERDKGFTMIISFVTVLVIAQVLPLIFAIVVKGWRG